MCVCVCVLNLTFLKMRCCLQMNTSRENILCVHGFFLDWTVIAFTKRFITCLHHPHQNWSPGRLSPLYLTPCRRPHLICAIVHIEAHRGKSREWYAWKLSHGNLLVWTIVSWKIGLTRNRNLVDRLWNEKVLCLFFWQEVKNDG